jgi:putative transposase
VSLLHMHLVFMIKYRPTLFTTDMLTFCERAMSVVCDEIDTELVALNGEAVNLHLLVAYPPNLSISVLVQRVKARTAYAVRGEFTGAGARARMRVHLW